MYNEKCGIVPLQLMPKHQCKEGTYDCHIVDSMSCELKPKSDSDEVTHLRHLRYLRYLRTIGNPPVFSFLSPIDDGVFSEGSDILFEGIVVDAKMYHLIFFVWTSSINGDFDTGIRFNGQCEFSDRWFECRSHP